MSTKKKDFPWNAAAHTIAKIEILKAYLTAWFPILGRSKRTQDLLYIDGFSGPGEYLNYPHGSPVVALEKAISAISALGNEWIAGKIHLAFIDVDPDILANLQKKIEAYSLPKRIDVHFYNKPFKEALSKLKVDIPVSFALSYPLFAFIDPFGATGVPFSVVSNLLSTNCSEVLINLDVDGVARIFAAGKSAAAEKHLNEILGTTAWQQKGWEALTADQRCKAVLELYKERLTSLPNVRYVFAFEMRTSHTAINYYLVFASQHYLGLEKMKEAMKKLDQDGTYSFSDARVQQPILFRFDDPDIWSERMLKAFRGKQTTYDDLNDFALNETPFINPKKMLAHLENAHRITVESTDPKRRKGTFNPKKIRWIIFSS